MGEINLANPLYQVHMPKLILSSCGIDHNIKFFSDYLPIINDSIILKKHKFQPKDVLKILTDAKSREYLPPAIYEAFAKASSELKKSIIADALKGIHNPKIMTEPKPSKLKLRGETDCCSRW